MMNLCPQVITLAFVLFINIVILAFIFGPTPLATIFAKTPLTYSLIVIFKLVSVYTLCVLKHPTFAWFATIMFSIVSLFTYSLTVFVTNYRDTLNPLMKEAIICLKKAKTHEERMVCRKSVLKKLKAKFISFSNTKSKPSK